MKKVKQETKQGHWLFEEGVAAIATKVGLKPDDRLRWIVNDFATHLNYTAGYQGGESPADWTPVSAARETSVFLLYQLGAGAYDMGDLPSLPPVLFENLAKEVDAGLDNFIAGKPWEVGTPMPIAATPDRTVWVVRSVSRGRDGDARNSWRAPRPLKDTFPMMFKLAVMDLLLTDGWRLARCENPDCAIRFVRKDRRQDYCTPRCSQAVRTERLRNPGKVEDQKSSDASTLKRRRTK